MSASSRSRKKPWGGGGGKRDSLEEGEQKLLSEEPHAHGSNHHHRHKKHKSDLDGDRGNIAILFLLYLLQGVPLGLCAAIPMLLQNKHVTYKDQASFSFTTWPFSLKLLWAPIVDSMYNPRIGRRKTWLIPTQYLIGLFMLVLSYHINDWLEQGTPNIPFLTFVFFCLNFLAATQDIAVDGWALTMLKRVNVSHASTCNSVGQTAGYFLGYVVFMAFDSAEFCNYFRSEPLDSGMLNLPGFLFFWGITFLVVTSLVALFKHERPADKSSLVHSDPDLNIVDSYKLLGSILKLPSIQKFALVLLTCKIGFSASDAITSLKLIEAGVPKEKFAIMAVPLVPLQIVLPLLLSKYTVGARPMDIYIRAIPYRLAFNFIAAFFVLITPYFLSSPSPPHTLPTYYYLILLVSCCIHQVSLYAMFVASMAFFARVSDPGVGGTYMTLLNTLSNLGSNWPNTVALWLVDALTWKQCTGDESNTCSDPALVTACEAGQGKCVTQLDGYYIEILLCSVIGYLWLFWGKRTIHHLQSRSSSAWQVSRVGVS
uniref:Acetyl-coenzyme A transporter 1 n=1 Tax=Cacopsylla melanoneura TaxID=428564 RepID=A0A8D8WK14_9HEMI